MYLVAFMDGHSRYVISWKLDQTLELAFVLQALRGAFDKGHRPGILNSNQGSHFEKDVHPKTTRNIFRQAGL